MASKSKYAAARLRRGTPVLITESVDEFAALRKALHDEIGPIGAIEQGFVEDLVAVMWEIKRVLRIKAEIWNGAFCKALIKILEQVWSEDFEDYFVRDRAIEDLAWQWLGNDSVAKAKVSELLGQHQLDETAIEAESFRMRVQELETLDRMLGLLEGRREKLLTGIAAYRDTLGRRLRQVSEQMLEQESVPQLVAIAKRGG
jgi:hypothetical protein